MEIKTVNSQSRIMLTKKWRSSYLKGKKAIAVSRDDVVEVKPFGKVDLTKYFDKAEVDTTSDLSEWHEVRRELRSL